jgi:hypothetical protein
MTSLKLTNPGAPIEAALTGIEEKTLRSIVIGFAEEPFTAEALEKANPGHMTGYEAELGIERLRKRGIIESRRKAWGETIHVLSPNLLPDWQRTIVSSPFESFIVSDEDIEGAYQPRSGFAKLLFNLLADAAYVGLPLTQKGFFHKKDIQRLLERMDISEAELSGLDITYIHQDKVPKPLAIVYDAALRLGLLRNGVGRVEIVTPRLTEWLQLSACEAERRILALWWDVYTPADIWLQHAAAAIRNLPKGCWCSADRMVDALLETGIPTGGKSRKEAMQQLRAYWLEPMAAFHWLELGQAVNRERAEETVIRWRELPTTEEEEEGWYVQPDFEMIVPPNLPYCARWELEAFGTYVGGDTVDRYKITKQSWERALDLGRGPDELLGTVRKYALYGVPEPVEQSLSQWSVSYGALVLEEVTLLRCKRAQDAAFLRSEEAFSGMIVEQINDLDFIVAKPHVKTLVEGLKKRGFSTKLGSVKPGSAVLDSLNTDSDASAVFGGGIVHSRRNVEVFPIDTAPAGMERLKERLQRVPQAWLRSFRKYHVSTIRELVETAIDVRTSVKLTVGSQTLEMVPMRVQSLGGDWIVQGFVDGQETSVSSDACAEAQLLIPEHS